MASSCQTGDLDTLAAYRREIIDLMAGAAALGVAAQVAASVMTGANLWATMAITLGSSLLIALSLWAERHWHHRVFLLMAATAGSATSLGLFYLNGGWDGTHLYPLLWIFALLSPIAMYGAWELSALTALAGLSTVVLGKLLCPDLLYGAGADQSWARIFGQTFWWQILLVCGTVTGTRVIRIARMADSARRALLASKEREAALLAQAERARQLAAAERAAALGDMARAFDDHVRSMVGTLAQTSAGIGARARELTQSASHTGERVRQAASLTTAVAEDTSVVAQKTAVLSGSLAEVRGQAADAALAAAAANDQMGRSNAALHALLEATGRVGQATSLISVIADRTNLLALNATIEAARAGDAGRGFAVVAGEVKQLARRAADTAAEIGLLLESMQQARQSATLALERIGRSIDQASSFAEQVSEQADAQAAAIGAITATIATLNDRTEGVRTQVGDVTQSAEATTRAAAAMLAAAASLGQDATALRDQASAFIARVRSG